MDRQRTGRQGTRLQAAVAAAFILVVLGMSYALWRGFRQPRQTIPPITWPTSTTTRSVGAVTGKRWMAVERRIPIRISDEELARAGKRYWAVVSEGRPWITRTVFQSKPRIVRTVPADGSSCGVCWELTFAGATVSEAAEIESAASRFESLMDEWVVRSAQ